MKTSATNRRLRLLLTGFRNGTIVPRPEFQRRLVWSNKHKNAFIDTVLLGYPFPEIYIAAGEVDPDTGEGKEMLVDGQQRVTTLYQYFTASPALQLESPTVPYAMLSEEDKIAFLEYEVVIRDLGNKNIAEIKEIFQRINSTNYALNAMEIHNARFEGEFKNYGEELSKDPFFEQNRIFLPNEIRRMNDVRFVLTFVATIMSTYFNRDSELENFLAQYNDEFDARETITDEIQQVFRFITQCDFDARSRAWKKADLLTLLVETYRALFIDGLELMPEETCSRLKSFYERVNKASIGEEKNEDVVSYHLATYQASNDRSSRITRGAVLRKLLRGELDSVVRRVTEAEDA